MERVGCNCGADPTVSGLGLTQEPSIPPHVGRAPLSAIGICMLMPMQSGVWWWAATLKVHPRAPRCVNGAGQLRIGGAIADALGDGAEDREHGFLHDRRRVSKLDGV